MKIAALCAGVLLACAFGANAGVFEEEYGGGASQALSPHMQRLLNQSQAEKKARMVFASENAPTIAYDSDVDPAIRRQMEQDLAFVYDLKGGRASNLHQQIFGPMSGPAYIRFFEQRIKEIGMDECGGGGGVVACVRFFFPNKMWLTQNFVHFNQPEVSRIETVFHEARHTESEHGGWSHATCPTPFRDENGQDIRGMLSGTLLQGKPACDTTELGAYATGLVMLKNIQKFCANCTEKVKMDAGIFGDDTLKRIIDARAKQAIVDDLFR